MVIPDYQVQTQDIMNYRTRNTGAESTPQEFDPFSEQAGQKLQEGFDALADENNRRETKEDFGWAQTQFASQQVQWAQNIKNYTDPDKLTQDLQSQTEQIMQTAPTGRASDFFVQHMNALVPKLVRRTMINQARAQVGAVSENYTSSANSLAMLATGSPLPDTSATLNTDGSPPVDPAPIVPMLGSASLRDVYSQTDAIKASATGTVPSALVNQTDATLKAQVAKGIIHAAAIEDGPGAIAASLEKNPSDVLGPATAAIPASNLTGIINDLRLKAASNQGVASLNADEALKKDIAATDLGNYPGDAAILSHAQMAGDVQGGKQGKRADEVTAKYLMQVQGAQDGFNFKTSIMGLPPDQMAEKMNDFNDVHGDNPHALALAQINYNKLLTTLKTSPADYPLESPNYRDSYNSAYSQLQADPTNPAVVEHFQNVLRGGITLQNGVRGVTADSPPDEVQKATSLAGVIPAKTAASLVSNIQNAPTQEAAQTIHQIQDQYGPFATNAMQDLQRAGLNPSFTALASFRDTPTEGTIINALNQDSIKGKGSLNDSLRIDTTENNKTLSAITNSADAAIKPYFNAVSTYNPKQANQIRDLVTTVAKYHMVNGQMNEKDASALAADEIINSQFDTGSVNNRSFLITKQFLADGNTQSVKDGATGMLPYIAKGDVMNPDIAGVFGRPGQDPTDDERDKFTQAVNRYGFWTQTADGKSLRLVINQQQAMTGAGIRFPTNADMPNAAGTGVASVLRKGGYPIEIPLSGFQAFSKFHGEGMPPYATPGYKPTSWVDALIQTAP